MANNQGSAFGVFDVSVAGATGFKDADQGDR